MEIFYEFNFDAAHQFEHMPEGHKYRRIHGHSFRAEVSVRGTPDKDTGFIVDLEQLERDCAKLRDKLDHGLLNEIDGLKIPSLENISKWIWLQLKPGYPGLSRILVRRDSCHQGCIYSGE